MKRVLLVLILFLLAASTAQASTFSPTWINHEFDMFARNDVFPQIDGWNYNDPARTIINVAHAIPYGTTVIEQYYYGSGNVINTRFNCSQTLYTITNCNLHVDSGNVSSDDAWSAIGFGDVRVYASILTDENGTTGFGLSATNSVLQYEFTPYTSVISLPALASSPIKSLHGQSGSKIELAVETVAYSDFGEYVHIITPTAQQKFDGTEQGLSDTITGLIYYFSIPLNYPILLVAFLEIFALMFALSGKNMKAWWQKYIDIHTQVFSFIADHSTIFLYFIAIILVIDMGNRLLSVLGWHP
jgi:hypothetical protein